MNVPTCDWGSSELCGRTATWVLYPDKFPGTVYACDQHAPRMSDADRAHRLPSAPPLPLDALKEYVTALAWKSVLLRDTPGNEIRQQNASAAFRNARDEYARRVFETLEAQ